MNKKIFRIAGAFIALIGIVLILNASSGITGFTILEGIGKTAGYIIGLVLILGGILFYMGGRMSEEAGLSKKLKVYDLSHGSKEAKPNEVYVLEDGYGNRITLGGLRRQITEYERDPDGAELKKILREEYSAGLQELALDEEEQKRKIATIFLEALGEKVPRESIYKLPKEERLRIINAFKDWRHHPNVAQAKILREYDFEFERGGSENKIRHRETRRYISVGSTPSDVHAGENNGKALCKLIEELRQHKIS